MAEPSVDVRLEGGPDGVPDRMSVRFSEFSARYLKIPFRAGYEHFVLDLESPGGCDEAPVFVWCDRTKVAE
ncbi:DUF5988 family protein [Amycolatopsis sp. NPDC059027]|uniref:DUF5988 family protein n=1 Tax=unclassified Amycolatopsis TaxID=2618356 RepID=UPI003673027A